MSLSLIAVFIPFDLVGGIVGRLFREFTVTLSVSILISLVISLTTTPMMCSRLLRREHRAAYAFRQGVRAILCVHAPGYERTLGWALDHRGIMWLIWVVTIGLNGYLYVAVPKGFMPQQDTGQIQGGIRGDAFTSFQLMNLRPSTLLCHSLADSSMAGT